MKNILVPMNFTDVGINALRYASNAFPDSQISILYVKEGLYSTNEPVVLSPGLLQEKFWEDAMLDFINRELKDENIADRINVKVCYGAIVAEINGLCAKSDFDAIVMGTKDKYSVFEKWFGTISLGTIKTASLPVYLIPKYASYKGFSKVVVASDDHLADPSFTKKIEFWNKDHKAVINFLHIQRDKDNSFNDETKSIVKEYFEKSNVDFVFEISVLKDKDISHSLLASAYDSKADLLIVVPEDQNFIQSVLFRSISKELVLQSDIPILFIRNKT